MSEFAAKPQRLGLGAVRRRYNDMAKGQALPAHKDRLLWIVARMLVHYENISERLFHTTEVTHDEEPRATLDKLLALSKEIRTNLAIIFEGEDAGELLRSLREQPRKDA